MLLTPDYYTSSIISLKAVFSPGSVPGLCILPIHRYGFFSLRLPHLVCFASPVWEGKRCACSRNYCLFVGFSIFDVCYCAEKHRAHSAVITLLWRPYWKGQRKWSSSLGGGWMDMVYTDTREPRTLKNVNALQTFCTRQREWTSSSSTCSIASPLVSLAARSLKDGS